MNKLVQNINANMRQPNIVMNSKEELMFARILQFKIVFHLIQCHSELNLW